MVDLWRSIALTSGARVYGLLAGMGTLIITARALGPVGRGELAAAVTWATTTATIGYMSLGQVALHKVTGFTTRSWIGPMLGSLLFITAGVSFIAWSGTALGYVATGGALYGDLPPSVLILGVAAVPFLVWEQYGSSLLMVVNRLGIYNRAQVIGRSAGLALAVVLVVVLRLGVQGALMAILAAQALVAMAGIRDLRSQAETPIRPDWPTTRGLIRGGLRLHLNAVGTFLFTHASILIVQYYRGSEETGYLQLAIQLISVAIIIPQAAAMVIYSRVAAQGPNGAWASNKQVLLILTAVMAGIAVIAAALAPVAIPLVVGDDFRPAIPLFQLLTLALVGQTLSAIMAPQWIGRGLFWQASLLTVATGVLNVVACLILVPGYGMFGAAWATVGVYTVSIASNGLFAVWVNGRAHGSQHCPSDDEPPNDPDTEPPSMLRDVAL